MAISATAPTASFDSFDGTPIRYLRFGTGSPVVLVHGSGGGLHSWQPVAELLRDRFELWLPARRGYAPSGRGAAPKHFSDEVRDLAVLIDLIGRPAHLVGMSYGATVALHAAAAGLPVRSLALWEPPLYAAGSELAPVLDRFVELTTNGRAEEAARLLALEVARVPVALFDLLTEAQPSDHTEQSAVDAAAPPGTGPGDDDSYGWSRDLESMIADTTYLDRWSAVTVSTLLLLGSDTWEPMPDTVERLATVLPHATLEILPHQTHFAPSTAPELVAETLAKYLY